MYKSTRLSIAFNELQLVQKCWTLDDVAVFEKMLVKVKYARRNEVTVNKKGFQEELRLGRRALDKSLRRLARAGLIIPVDKLTYSIARVPVIISRYYNPDDVELLKFKLNYYLDKPFGKFDITNASK